jgi:hypothetical protein
MQNTDPETDLPKEEENQFNLLFYKKAMTVSQIRVKINERLHNYRHSAEEAVPIDFVSEESEESEGSLEIKRKNLHKFMNASKKESILAQLEMRTREEMMKDTQK